MRAVRTAGGALAALSLTACASLTPHDPEPSPQNGAERTVEEEVPAWIESLDEATLQAALGGSIPTLGQPLAEDLDPGTATAPGPASIWDRIRGSFKLPHYDNERVQRQRQALAGRDAYFERVGQRAEPYLHYILEQLEARDLPAELIALAIVESGLQPFAYSHGQAAGLWQLVPGTARSLGLEINYWYDGRRDLVAATDAALDHLERLHADFDGDWLLAMAAYNAGKGNVRAAQRRARAAGKAPTFWALELSAETERYVPRILAIRDILRDPAQYQVSLPQIPDEPRIRVVELEHQIELALAAELADIPKDRLYRLNPGLNRWATAPSGPHRLVLPRGAAARFERELAAMDPEALVKWRRHEIEPGETLSNIARQYDVTVELLRELNGLRGETIRTGEHLHVPISSRPAEEYALSAANRLEALKGRERRGERHSHTVQPGETLWDIARSYDVSVEELASWNGMAPGDPLQPRQELAIRATDEAQQAAGPGGGHRTRTVTYTVQPGDSLARIARRFNVGVQDIRRWNDITEGSHLHPGDELHLEIDVTEQSASL
ncbi:MAG: LysM peptidoglycan-binding domain-containing protein [Halorhodospira sp.]